MASKFAIGDKVDQAFATTPKERSSLYSRTWPVSTVMRSKCSANRTIQIASKGSLVAHGNLAL
jgi:hypothetical protein